MIIREKYFSKLIKLIVDKNSAENLIKKFCNIYQIDMLKLAYKRNGILNYKNSTVSGEKYVLEHVLPFLIDNPTPILFDIGANDGRTTIEFGNVFQNANIYAFEPNKESFSILKNNCKDFNIICINYGLGATDEEKKIFTYRSDLASGHASLYEKVFTSIHKNDEIEGINVNITTIDNFAESNLINYIDFLKIDTEGHDYFVLQGAHKLLQNNKIGIIQFEFNEMNVVSRVFLKDFYDYLRRFKFYRICENSLIRLGDYNTRNEIFKFQNILAIHERYYDKVNLLI